MRTEIVSDWRRFDELKKDWNTLLSLSRADIIFLRWEWIDTWRRIHGDAIKPFIVVAWDDARNLAGIAPFYKTIYLLVRVLPYRVLRIMGDFPTGAECLDWILRSDCEKEAARCIADTLAKTADDWDLIWIPYVPLWTGGRDRIHEAAKDAGFYFSERDVGFGYIDLPGSLDDMLSAMGSSHRYNTRRDLKRMFSEPTTVFFRCVEEQDISRYLDSLFHLHSIRWSREGQLGTFRRKPNEAMFYRLFALEAHKQGWLGLYGVEYSGEIKAVQYGYIYNGSFLQMQEGFDQERGRGLGNLLRFKVIEDLISGGIKVYDFLGEMSEHKNRWHATERTGRHLMIGNRKLKNRILFSNNVWPTGRYLKPSEIEIFRGQQ